MATEIQETTPGGIAIPDALPVLPLPAELVVFPLAVTTLFLGRPSWIRLVDDVMRKDRLVALVGQRANVAGDPGPEDLHRIGLFAGDFVE